MNNFQAQKNIKLYYWFQLFRQPLFLGPIFIMYIQKVSGMSLADIFFMESVVVAGLILLEIPTGALADLVGRRTTILAGHILLTIVIMLFAAASTPFMIWFANIVWVVGFSLRSGADSSFLYDSLLFLGDKSKFKKIQGKSISYQLGLVALSSILAGYLAEVHIRLPAYLSVIFVATNCFIVFKFTEPPLFTHKNYSWREHWHKMKNSVLFVANHSKIKWIIGFTILIAGVSKLWFFTYNPYFELVNLPLSYFGWIFFLLNIIAALSSYYADWFSKKVGDLTSIVLMLLFIAVPIFIMGSFVVQVGVLLVLMPNLVRGYIKPFMDHFLHHFLDSKNRATVTSIQSAATGFAQFILLAVFGWVLKIIPLPATLQILGIFTLVVGFILIFTYHKIFVSSKNN